MSSIPSAVEEKAVPHKRKAVPFFGYFYAAMGVLALLYVLAGFSPTYFIPVSAGKATFQPLYHIHAAMFMLWIFLAISQPILIRRRQFQLHRKIGYAGLALAVGMFVIGIVMAITSTRAAINTGIDGTPRLAFLIVPLTDMLAFGTFIAVAMFNLRNSETHKRLILLATLSIVPAAFGRIIGIYGLNNWVGIILMESILILAVIYDLYTRGKIHPVYIFGGGIIVLLHLTRFQLGETEGWLTIARWLTGV